MHELIDLYHKLTSPEWINLNGGLYIVLFIIFAETGLFVGFFLPGDSLLFITGMIISVSHTPFDSEVMNLLYWIVIITTAGFVGNMVGYWFGKKSGPLLFERRETWLFKRKHLLQAHDFYEKRGGSAIIIARFLPIVRTFAPIIAGIVKMDFKKFVLYNIIGCAAWVVSMIMAGFLLGKNVWVKDHVDLIVIALIIVTTGPVLIKIIFGKKKVEGDAPQP